MYDLAFRQFEISGTRPGVFDRPAAGRAFFEGLIRDHLDLGRPGQVSLAFDPNVRLAGSRPAPGTFRTRVITRGVDPEIACYYRSSRLKQYFREHRALRAELVACDSRDFGARRRATYENRNALRVAGEHASQRLCDAEAASAQPAPDVAILAGVTRPSDTDDGQHAPALRSGDARVMALMAAIAGFTCVIAGFGNRGLATRMRALPDPVYSSRHATYDLRRLRRKQLITRIPGTHRYQLTPSGRAVAVLFTNGEPSRSTIAVTIGLGSCGSGSGVNARIVSSGVSRPARTSRVPKAVAGQPAPGRQATQPSDGARLVSTTRHLPHPLPHRRHQPHRQRDRDPPPRWRLPRLTSGLAVPVSDRDKDIEIPEAAAFARAIGSAPTRRMSAVTLVEL